jgi:hypothetical protein
VHLAWPEEEATHPSLGKMPAITTTRMPVQADVAFAFEAFCERYGYNAPRAAAAALILFCQFGAESRWEAADSLYQFERRVRRNGEQVTVEAAMSPGGGDC